MAIAAFVENDFQPGVVMPRTKMGSRLDTQMFAAGDNSLRYVREERFVAHVVDLYMVGLIQMRIGRGDRRRPLGIVGEEKESFTGFVEPPDGSDPGNILGKQL